MELCAKHRFASYVRRGDSDKGKIFVDFPIFALIKHIIARQVVLNGKLARHQRGYRTSVFQLILHTCSYDAAVAMLMPFCYQVLFINRYLSFTLRRFFHMIHIFPCFKSQSNLLLRLNTSICIKYLSSEHFFFRILLIKCKILLYGENCSLNGFFFLF